MRGAFFKVVERDSRGKHVVVETDEMRQFGIENDAFAALFLLDTEIFPFAEERLSRLPFLRPFCR